MTRVSRHIRAPRSIVYRSLLDRAAVERWTVPDGMTSQIHSFHAREGGAFRISFTYDASTTAGKTTAQTVSFHGRFVKLVRHRAHRRAREPSARLSPAVNELGWNMSLAELAAFVQRG